MVSGRCCLSYDETRSSPRAAGTGRQQRSLLDQETVGIPSELVGCADISRTAKTTQDCHIVRLFCLGDRSLRWRCHSRGELATNMVSIRMLPCSALVRRSPSGWSYCEALHSCPHGHTVDRNSPHTGPLKFREFSTGMTALSLTHTELSFFGFVLFPSQVQFSAEALHSHTKPFHIRQNILASENPSAAHFILTSTSVSAIFTHQRVFLTARLPSVVETRSRRRLQPG